MTCHSCLKQKNTIEACKSKLFKEVVLLLCNSCREAKLEPRHIVVLIGRSYGPAVVREYIVKKLYLGDEITAAELIP